MEDKHVEYVLRYNVLKQEAMRNEGQNETQMRIRLPIHVTEEGLTCTEPGFCQTYTTMSSLNSFDD